MLQIQHGLAIVKRQRLAELNAEKFWLHMKKQTAQVAGLTVREFH